MSMFRSSFTTAAVCKWYKQRYLKLFLLCSEHTRGVAKIKLSVLGTNRPCSVKHANMLMSLAFLDKVLQRIFG